MEHQVITPGTLTCMASIAATVAKMVSGCHIYYKSFNMRLISRLIQATLSLKLFRVYSSEGNQQTNGVQQRVNSTFQLTYFYPRVTPRLAAFFVPSCNSHTQLTHGQDTLLKGYLCTTCSYFCVLFVNFLFDVLVASLISYFQWQYECLRLFNTCEISTRVMITLGELEFNVEILLSFQSAVVLCKMIF